MLGTNGMAGISGRQEGSASNFNPTDQRQAAFVGYGPAKLPEPRDGHVQKVIDQLTVGGGSEFASALSAVTDKARDVLCAYAERMASLAVRRQDEQLLIRALVALVLGGLNENSHESLMVMAPIEDSARRIGVDLTGLCERVSKIVGHPGTVNLMRWLARQPQDRSLASMGFVATEDGDGFRYRFAR